MILKNIKNIGRMNAKLLKAYNLRIFWDAQIKEVQSFMKFEILKKKETF